VSVSSSGREKTELDIDEVTRRESTIETQGLGLAMVEVRLRDMGYKWDMEGGTLPMKFTRPGVG
jgi:hypothetical protein